MTFIRLVFELCVLWLKPEIYIALAQCLKQVLLNPLMRYFFASPSARESISHSSHSVLAICIYRYLNVIYEMFGHILWTENCFFSLCFKHIQKWSLSFQKTNQTHSLISLQMICCRSLWNIDSLSLYSKTIIIWRLLYMLCECLIMCSNLIDIVWHNNSKEKGDYDLSLYNRWKRFFFCRVDKVFKKIYH